MQCVALLVAAGADVDAAAQVEPLPPLAAAVITGRAEIAQMLLGRSRDSLAAVSQTSTVICT